MLNSFTPCTGIVLSDDEREAAYAQLLDAFGALELPGKNAKLPATYAEAADYYETMVRDELQANTFLQRVTVDLTRLPLPTLVMPGEFASAAGTAVAGAAASRRPCRQGVLLRHPASRNPRVDRLSMGIAPRPRVRALLPATPAGVAGVARQDVADPVGAQSNRVREACAAAPVCRG